MKLLGVYPQIFSGDKRLKDPMRIFPWGFASVLTCLTRDGHEATVIDAYGQDYLRKDLPAVLDRRQDHEVVLISGFASMNYAYVVWLAEQLKARSPALVVVGGLLAQLHFDRLLAKGTIDVCVLGDGEETGVDLLRNLGRLDRVKGIAWRKNGQVVINEPRPPVRDLDAVPIPDFDLFDIEPYLNSPMFLHMPTSRYSDFPLRHAVKPEDLFPNFGLLAGRGCPYRCKFCARSSDTLRLKSVDRIIEEITVLKARYGVKAVQFKDELLIVNRSRTRELCDRIKPLGVYWECQGRINTVDEEILEMLSDAGCLTVGFGVESGSDRMLDSMGKGTTRAQSIRTLKAAKKVGVHMKLQFMLGYPGEDRQSVEDTASLFGEVGIPPRRFTWCTPLPGSDLYEEVKASGLIPDEEAYLMGLQKGMNRPGRLVLNVSGKSDREMLELFDYAHIQAERRYIRALSNKAANLADAFFWHKLSAFLVALEKHLLDHPKRRGLPRPVVRTLQRLTGEIGNLLAKCRGGKRQNLEEIRAKRSLYHILFFR